MMKRRWNRSLLPVLALALVMTTLLFARVDALSGPIGTGRGAFQQGTSSAGPGQRAATPIVGGMMGGTSVAGCPVGTPSVQAAMPREYDLMFIDMMIRHHEGAIAMATLAQERAEHQEIRDLAQAIVTSQTSEIEQMRAWRATWYPDAPTMPRADMDREMDRIMLNQGPGGMMGTPGAGRHGMMGTPGAGMGNINQGYGINMMDPEEMRNALLNATVPFDQAFLELMIPHHESAIAMAQTALHNAKHEEILSLSQAIIDAQQKEIDQMRTWLTEWYGNAGA